MERDFFIVLLLSHNSQYNIGDWCLQTVAPVSVNHGLKLTNHGILHSFGSADLSKCFP